MDLHCKQDSNRFRAPFAFEILFLLCLLANRTCPPPRTFQLFCPTEIVQQLPFRISKKKSKIIEEKTGLKFSFERYFIVFTSSGTKISKMWFATVGKFTYFINFQRNPFRNNFLKSWFFFLFFTWTEHWAVMTPSTPSAKGSKVLSDRLINSGFKR